jgi:hypothetical protein
MSHDSVIRQLPVDSHVLRVGQGSGCGSVLRRRVWSSSSHEQAAFCSHHVAVQHLVDQSSEKEENNTNIMCHKIAKVFKYRAFAKNTFFDQMEKN